MTNQSSHLRVHACVLAAGTASRFGTNKLLQEFKGRPLLQHALIAARDACPAEVTLIAGHDQENIVRAAENFVDNVVVNEQYEEGIGSSIAAAARNCGAIADGILIMLADQPLITSDHLRELIRAWSADTGKIVATTFASTRCPPIIFPTATFDSLCSLRGDRGAKDLLRSGAFSVETIDFPMAKHDVDTPEDIRNLEAD